METRPAELPELVQATGGVRCTFAPLELVDQPQPSQPRFLGSVEHRPVNPVENGVPSFILRRFEPRIEPAASTQGHIRTETQSVEKQAEWQHASSAQSPRADPGSWRLHGHGRRRKGELYGHCRRGASSWPSFCAFGFHAAHEQGPGASCWRGRWCGAAAWGAGERAQAHARLKVPHTFNVQPGRGQGLLGLRGRRCGQEGPRARRRHSRLDMPETPECQGARDLGPRASPIFGARCNWRVVHLHHRTPSSSTTTRRWAARARKGG